MWRFSLVEKRWYAHQISDTEGAGVWPQARQSASIASGGFMYGGMAGGSGSECLLKEDSLLGGGGGGIGVPLLSGLWRWEDDVGNMFR
eukprot:COSAG02_NODE_14491_length_1266_cov_3.392459_1_plen_88_part_00